MLYVKYVTQIRVKCISKSKISYLHMRRLELFSSADGAAPLYHEAWRPQSAHWEHDLSSPDIWKNGGSWKVTGLMWQFMGLPPLCCAGCTHSLISWQDRVAHWHDSVTSLRSKRRSGISFAPHRDPRRGGGGWDEVRRSHSCLSSTAAEWREALGEWHSQRPVLKSLKRTKREEEQGGWD